MTATRTRIERLEAQAADQHDPIASGRIAYRLRVRIVSDEAYTYEAWDATTGQHIPITEALRASIERREAEVRKRGIYRRIVADIGGGNG
jgi:hypothetical protein